MKEEAEGAGIEETLPPEMQEFKDISEHMESIQAPKPSEKPSFLEEEKETRILRCPISN